VQLAIPVRAQMGRTLFVGSAVWVGFVCAASCADSMQVPKAPWAVLLEESFSAWVPAQASSMLQRA